MLAVGLMMELEVGLRQDCMVDDHDDDGDDGDDDDGGEQDGDGDSMIVGRL